VRYPQGAIVCHGQPYLLCINISLLLLLFRRNGFFSSFIVNIAFNLFSWVRCSNANERGAPYEKCGYNCFNSKSCARGPHWAMQLLINNSQSRKSAERRLHIARRHEWEKSGNRTVVSSIENKAEGVKKRLRSVIITTFYVLFIYLFIFYTYLNCLIN
jgi:hypothetical protein